VFLDVLSKFSEAEARRQQWLRRTERMSSAFSLAGHAYAYEGDTQ
jgi:hypothetical protein